MKDVIVFRRVSCAALGLGSAALLLSSCNLLWWREAPPRLDQPTPPAPLHRDPGHPAAIPGPPAPPPPEPPKPPQPLAAGIPVAKAVPGKPGFVFSPFNNQLINVKDLKSGTLVADPRYPPAEKKYFRVP